jgi:amino acid transporter
MSDKNQSVVGTKTAQPFMRESSGLVRAMPPYSAFAYNILNIGVIFPWVYLLSAGAFPGSNIALGILLTGVFASILAYVYSGLASVMPRTGGDYLFQSRVLSPWVGFPIVATMVLFWFLQWDALGGWLTSLLGIAPMLTGLGLTTGSQWLINAGTWFTTPLGIWITTIVFGAIATLTLIRGFQLFVKIQWFMWYGFLVSFATIVGLLLLTPHASFVSHFNTAVNRVSPSSGRDFYDYVINYEKSHGFSPSTAFSWAATLGVMPIALTSLGWVGYAQYQAGEIRQASSIRKQLFINLGGGVASALMMALLAFALTRAVGYNWLSAAAYGNYITGNLGMPIPPWFSNLVVVLTSNPLIVVLATVGIFLNALQVVYNVYIGQTRMAFATAMDRILPAWVFKINEKTGTPVNAQVLFFVLGGIVYSFVYNFVPGWITYTLAVTAVATVMYIATSVAGALLPYRMRDAYRNSEVSAHRILGVPAITVAGAVSAAFSAWMLYYYLTVPSLGVASPQSEALMLAIFLGWLAYFAVRRVYVKRKTGIGLDLAFKEIPPE